MATNNQNNGNNSNMSGNEIPFIVMLLAAAGIYKYQARIEAWFHDNMITVVLGGAAVLVGLGYFIIWRMKKKNKEAFERMERLARTSGANRSTESFYERQNNRGER